MDNNSKTRIFPNRIYQCIIIFFVVSCISVWPVAATQMPQDVSSLLMYGLMFMLSAITFLGFNWKNSKDLFREKQLPTVRVLILLALGFIALPLAYYLFSLWIGINNSTAQSNSYTIISMLYIVIIGPVVEEFIFRGIFLRGLLTRYAPTISIVATSLLFAIIHFNAAPEASLTANVTEVSYALLMGLILGEIYYKSCSLFLCIILHILANAVTLTLMSIHAFY